MGVNNKRYCITMRASKDEYESLKSLAEAFEISMSDILRFSMAINWNRITKTTLEKIERELTLPFNARVRRKKFK